MVAESTAAELAERSRARSQPPPASPDDQMSVLSPNRQEKAVREVRMQERLRDAGGTRTKRKSRKAILMEAAKAQPAKKPAKKPATKKARTAPAAAPSKPQPTKKKVADKKKRDANYYEFIESEEEKEDKPEEKQQPAAKKDRRGRPRQSDSDPKKSQSLQTWGMTPKSARQIMKGTSPTQQLNSNHTGRQTNSLHLISLCQVQRSNGSAATTKQSTSRRWGTLGFVQHVELPTCSVQKICGQWTFS